MLLKASFRGLGRGLRGFGIDFSGVLLNLCRAGWIVLWHYITTGGFNLTAPTYKNSKTYKKT